MIQTLRRCTVDRDLEEQRTDALLVFNLFALEGFHIAEALAVPCAAVSPCLVPSAPPAGFERRLRAAHPRLYQRLKLSEPGATVFSSI